MSAPVARLNRTFYDLPDPDAELEDHLEWLSYYDKGRQLSWKTLMQSRRILIVSEAGMGKSYECSRQQEELWANGEPAFFIELAALLDGDPRKQLSGDQKQRLTEWECAQTEIATFFLDSADEHALTQASFDLTLKQFASHLGNRLDRVRVVITTRPIPLDLASVERHLPVPDQSDPIDPKTYFADVAMGVEKTAKENVETAPVWRNVALAPLDPSLMHELAIREGIAKPDLLLSEITKHHAHDFAKRPLDFIALCADWRRHQALRTHRDQIESDVTRKLKPRSQSDRKDRTILSPGKAREGAERLALAAQLTRRFTFWHSRDSDLSRGEEALDPSVALETFTTDEIWALLERPLFGLATYGRVRFHNRSVIEYLAAKRLATLCQHGMPTTTLKRLLFGTSPMGIHFVRPSMRPVAAWMAIEMPDIFEEVCRREPDVLLRHGDPEQLSLEARVRALTQFVSKHGPGNWRGQSLPSMQIRRFARPDLAPCIATLWSNGIENPEVREILLEVIGAGRVGDCADIAYHAAVDRHAPRNERIHGLLSLGELKDDRLPGLLREMVHLPEDWPESLVDSAIVHMFPAFLSAKSLVSLLARLTYRKKNYIGAKSILPAACEKAILGTQDLSTLTTGIYALLLPTCAWSESRHRNKGGTSRPCRHAFGR